MCNANSRASPTKCKSLPTFWGFHVHYSLPDPDSGCPWNFLSEILSLCKTKSAKSTITTPICHTYGTRNEVNSLQPSVSCAHKIRHIVTSECTVQWKSGSHPHSKGQNVTQSDLTMNLKWEDHRSPGISGQQKTKRRHNKNFRAERVRHSPNAFQVHRFNIDCKLSQNHHALNAETHHNCCEALNNFP